MKIKVNAELNNWREFALRMLDGEVFYSENASYWYAGHNYEGFLCRKLIGLEYKFHPKHAEGDDDFLKCLFIEEENTLANLIQIKPRLCRVWDNDKEGSMTRLIAKYNPDEKYPYRTDEDIGYKHAELLSDYEIAKEFFNEE